MALVAASYEAVDLLLIINPSFVIAHTTVCGGGGWYPGGTLIFSAYLGSDPASTVHQKKKYQEFQAPQKYLKF